MQRLALAAVLWLAALLPAGACVLPITLINGTLADAGQVMQNMTALLSCVNTGGATTWANITGTPSTLAGYGVTTVTNTPIVGGTISGGTALSGVALTASAWSGGAITDLSAPTNAGDAATKAYVDAHAAGLIFQTQVKWATAAALATNTYANGASGVGATLTATANAALTVDGNAVAASDRILVKNEATQSHNGAYSVTATGDGSNPYVLTRVTDWDQSAEMVAGSAFFVTAGTANASTTWSMSSAASPTVGTTSITFVQAGASSSYTAGGGLGLAGSVFSITAPVSIANGGSNTTSQTTSGMAYYDGSKITTGAVFAVTAPATGSQLGAASGHFKTTGTGLVWSSGNTDVNAAGIWTSWALPTYSGIVANQTYALNGSGNVFQIASYLTQSGSMNSTALYGEAATAGSGAGVWGLNTIGKCAVNASSCVSIEADVAITNPTPTNAIGVLMSFSQLGCVPTGVNDSCHPNAAFQVNTNLADADVTAYTGHANNRGYIPSTVYGTLYGSATSTVAGTTRTWPAVSGTLLQACCYNASPFGSTVGGLGTVFSTVTGIDLTTATFSSAEISTNNFLAGATAANTVNRVQVTGSITGVRPIISTNSAAGEPANRGIILSGTGTGIIAFGNLGTQTGVCTVPNSSGSAPLLTSCPGVGGGGNVGLTISTGSGTAVGFSVPLGFPTYTVASLGACGGSQTGWRAYISDGSGSAFHNAQAGGGTIGEPVFCDGGGSWRNG